MLQRTGDPRIQRRRLLAGGGERRRIPRVLRREELGKEAERGGKGGVFRAASLVEADIDRDGSHRRSGRAG